MPVGDLRALVYAANRAAHGVACTIVRPAPDDAPITSTGIWWTPDTEEHRVGTEFQRREPRRVLVLPRSNELPQIPRGTLVTAPDETNGPAVTWRVDGTDWVESDAIRVVVTRAPGVAN